ncbi:diaminopimelate epimerase [Salipaludibacillus sp. LMS25]|uniref:diaminopimelate epimerase n=1 Tax=Salipaludibacillus sp. LMS25 TaxID=2924031 RepID=UPI0020D1466E|nr:diaminopimelate epimerase [Salipaludibacillus sp. LMS25]UTR14312.1 diaminopimelate epimerase [Salipaludibacillus sp. LMS25]
MKLDILKCHGSGNDFIIIDEMAHDDAFSEQQRIMISKELAGKDYLIGSDGILFVQKSTSGDATMRMFNTDGSEAEMCGNGLRCVARYVGEKLGRESMVIETMKANLEVAKVEDIFPNNPTYEVAIEPVSLKPKTIPLISDDTDHINKPIKGLPEHLTFTALSVPNPHIVALVDDVDEKEIEAVGKEANDLKNILPNGVNVSFLKKVGDSKIFVQTYERGVGLTNACGTAMSASSLVSCLLGLNTFNEKILVLNRGGMVQCLVQKDDEGQFYIKLRGNATYEYSATVDFDFTAPESSEVSDMTHYEDETANYAALAKAAKNVI